MELVPPVYRFGKLIILQPHVLRWVAAAEDFSGCTLCTSHHGCTVGRSQGLLDMFFLFGKKNLLGNSAMWWPFFLGGMVMVILCDPVTKRRIGYLSFLGGQRVFHQKGLFGDIIWAWLVFFMFFLVNFIGFYHGKSPLHVHHHLEIFHFFQPP